VQLVGQGSDCESVLFAALRGCRDVLTLQPGCATAMLFHFEVHGVSLGDTGGQLLGNNKGAFL
jgi:hypothetical protein